MGFRLPWVTYRQKYHLVSEWYYEASKDKRLLENSLNAVERQQEALFTVLKRFTSDYFSCILKVIMRNNEIIVISCEKHSGDITLKLHVVNNGNTHYQRSVLYACYGNEKVYIEDIQGFSNQGYGTLLITELFEVCKSSGFRRVTGHLSDVDLNDTQDLNHAPRLLHFYEKNGFTIHRNEKNVPMRVSIDLI